VIEFDLEDPVFDKKKEIEEIAGDERESEAGIRVEEV
jgi:hypothetical protein